MTTLVHIGDIHAAPGPRRGDIYAALEQIFAECCWLEIGAWLIPGDLFDAKSHVDDRNALAAWLQKLSEVAPVVMCPGNHDAPGDLDIFKRLAADHPLYVVTQPKTIRIELATGGWASIFVLPYPSKAGLVGAGIATGDVVNTASDLLEPIFMQAAGELEEARGAGDLALMIGHVNVAGAITSSGQPNIGREIELHPAHLDRLGDIPKLLNHIHKPQEIAGAHYAGSVCRLSYGEIEEKSYSVVTLENRSSQLGAFVEWTIERKPIAVPPMFHVELEWTRGEFVGRPHGFGFQEADGTDEATTQRFLAADWHGCDVRVRIRVLASERKAMDLDEAHALFASALRLKVETITIPDRELRAPEVAAATTLEAKLAAYRKEPALPDSVAAKLSLLQGHPADGVLADVAERVEELTREREAVPA